MRWALVLALAGCGEDRRGNDDELDALARAQYPDVSALYAGDHGVYRGCGPNGGVCHNGNEFPNLSSLGSIVANINVPCNQKRDSAIEFDDMCERTGDRVEIAGQKIEIGFIEVLPDPAYYRLWLRAAPMTLPTGEALMVWRAIPDGAGGMLDMPFLPLTAAFLAYGDDPAEMTGRAILLARADDPQGAIAGFLDESGLPRPDRFHYGDPNRNGTFGADLGARLIKPGDPDKSYLLRRLTDSTMGPLMPRANCCSWTKTSLRAMWCWIDGLAPDGSNATAPINYDTCRPSPPDQVLYPEPGAMCETQALCPVQPIDDGGTSFGSIYTQILTARCAGDGCHDTGNPGGVDFRSRAAAFETLAEKVVPGDPDASVLYRRLSPTLCIGACKTMPLDRPPLAAAQLDRIRTWIAEGAADD